MTTLPGASLEVREQATRLQAPQFATVDVASVLEALASTIDTFG